MFHAGPVVRDRPVPLGDWKRRPILVAAAIAVAGGLIGLDVGRVRDAQVPFNPWFGVIGIVSLIAFVFPVLFERVDWLKRSLRTERPMAWVVLAMVTAVTRFMLEHSMPRVDAHTEMLEFAAFWLVGPTLWVVMHEDVRHAARWLAPLLTATQGATAALSLAALGDPRGAWLAAAGTLLATAFQSLVLRRRRAEPVRAAAGRSFGRRSRAGGDTAQASSGARRRR